MNTTEAVTKIRPKKMEACGHEHYLSSNENKA